MSVVIRNDSVGSVLCPQKISIFIILLAEKWSISPRNLCVYCSKKFISVSNAQYTTQRILQNGSIFIVVRNVSAYPMFCNLRCISKIALCLSQQIMFVETKWFPTFSIMMPVLSRFHSEESVPPVLVPKILSLEQNKKILFQLISEHHLHRKVTTKMVEIGIWHFIQVTLGD